MKYKRIYHPTANTFRDVPEGEVKAWTDAGWKSDNPGQVTASATLGGDPRKVTATFPAAAGDPLPASVTEPTTTLTTASDAAPASGR